MRTTGTTGRSMGNKARNKGSNEWNNGNKVWNIKTIGGTLENSGWNNEEQREQHVEQLRTMRTKG